MNRYKRNCFLIILCICMLCFGFDTYDAKASIWEYCPQLEAKSAAIVDVETGVVLMEKNAYKKSYPASITKVMTALLTLNNMKSFEEKIVFNKKAVTMEDLYSKTLWMEEGEVISLKDALYGLLLESANDVAKGLAFHIGGSLEGFSAMMNKKAEELGCVNTNFVNPHGLFEENHYTCAADMAKIMAACAKNPRFVEIAGTLYYTIPKTNKFKYRRFLSNDSKMLMKKSPYYYEKCYGAKTGFTNESKKTYIAIAKKGKHRLAGVIMGTSSLEGQYRGLEEMFEHCFSNFKQVKAGGIPITFPKNRDDLYEAVLKRDERAVFKPIEDVNLVLPKKYEKEKIQAVVTYEKLDKIKVGINRVGRVSYLYEGREVGANKLYYGSYNEFSLK